MGPRISPQALEKLRENSSRLEDWLFQHSEDPHASQNLEARLAEIKQSNTSSDKK